MRWIVVCFFLFSVSCFAQEEPDSIEQRVHIPTYQEGNPWNGTIISAMQNPAFAGFDRRLQIGYSYEGQNLKVSEGFETKKAAFWNQKAEIDFAFGGKRDNVGLNITYSGGQRLITDYHRVQLAHSFRFHLKEHRFILGAGIRYLQLKGGNWSMTYGDMIDPRYGFVYPTQETIGYNQGSVSLEYSAGFIYNWKRFFFGYAFRYEHRSLLLPAKNDLTAVHHLNASYQLQFASAGGLVAGLTAEYDSFDWFIDPFLLASWKFLYVKASVPNLTQVRAEIGLQIWRVRVLFAVSSYYDKYQVRQNGVAAMYGGIRYHFQPLISKKK